MRWKAAHTNRNCDGGKSNALRRSVADVVSTHCSSCVWEPGTLPGRSTSSFIRFAPADIRSKMLQIPYVPIATTNSFNEPAFLFWSFDGVIILDQRTWSKVGELVSVDWLRHRDAHGPTRPTSSVYHTSAVARTADYDDAETCGCFSDRNLDERQRRQDASHIRGQF